MADLPPYRNAERVAFDAIADLFAGSTHLGVETPPDLQARLPFGRVRRIGGFDADPFTDGARLAVDVYAATYAAGTVLAEAVRQRLRAAPDPIDRAVTLSGPAELPWEDPGTRRWSATYELHLRRTPAA